MRFVFLLLISLSVSVLFSAAACGPVEPVCGPQNCDGCCSEAGRCRLGQQVEACGTSGQACTSCNAAQVCQAGACLAFSGSGSDGGCNGCRDAQGICHAGQSEVRCGSGGEQCVACAGGESCQNGACGPGGCKSDGSQCILNGECCSNLCNPAGTCAPRPDAGMDGGDDAGMDGGDDAGEDGGTDGGMDGGTDGGTKCSIDPCKEHFGPATANCACVQTICGLDPYCCNSQWDSACVDAASAICPECAGGSDAGGPFDGGPSPGCAFLGTTCASGNDCCSATCDQGVCAPNPNGGVVSCGAVTNICATSPGPATPASCDPCVQSICSYDPYCCTYDWDSACVDEATYDCDGRCP